MVKQYPYNLYAELQEEAIRDEKGNWLPPKRQMVFVGICRDETNGSGALITGIDGQEHKYTWTIYAPKNIMCLEEGTTIEVQSPCGCVRVRGEIQRYSRDQLHTRIWV